MAKVGKLTKLKSAMKRWPSFTKHHQTTGKELPEDDGGNDESLHVVYVGKSRRRYMLSSDIVRHPLFQELVDRSRNREDDQGQEITIACEVVLFEHLLWMLRNSSPGAGGDVGGDNEMGSMEDLVEFYTC